MTIFIRSSVYQGIFYFPTYYMRKNNFFVISKKKISKLLQHLNDWNRSEENLTEEKITQAKTVQKIEQNFKLNSVNADRCNIQSCINCKSLLMMTKISSKCTTLHYIEI
ncbi:hypothetical protein BpHYR1_040042 [Brachionus plicatilis]|uniref:Uncharacterized protein n=1 Tax=Brachionus plicatilis TaxID=10195 RepID=A0A3M7R5Y3_BRAPC|nr:hypothetical protein BpHYR1_040042 [Brachionus plicatilis]